jgi:predicted phosphate transport protein (TIGR00153 family)
MTSIFNMFGTSPIKPIQEHMSVVACCVEELAAFFKAVVEKDWVEAEKRQQKISTLEHEADVIKRNVRSNLPRKMFTSIDRGDLLALFLEQDLLANRAKDIAGIILGRQMVFPQHIVASFMIYLDRSIDATFQARKAINQLEELQEVGFSGKEVRIVEHMIAQLETIEHETDLLQIQLRRSLQALEKEWPAVDMMFLYRIIEWVGDLADQAQKVGARLQMLLAS